MRSAFTALVGDLCSGAVLCVCVCVGYHSSYWWELVRGLSQCVRRIVCVCVCVCVCVHVCVLCACMCMCACVPRLLLMEK